jgi:DNA/RNA endonuclease YhcR with UshA esterase domain
VAIEQLADAEKSLASVKDKTREKLAATGLKIETMPAWPSNHNAAAIQLDQGHVAKAAPVQAAVEAVRQAKARRDHLTAQRRQQRDNAVTIADVVARYIAQLIGVPPVR